MSFINHGLFYSSHARIYRPFLVQDIFRNQLDHAIDQRIIFLASWGGIKEYLDIKSGICASKSAGEEDHPG